MNGENGNGVKYTVKELLGNMQKDADENFKEFKGLLEKNGKRIDTVHDCLTKKISEVKDDLTKEISDHRLFIANNYTKSDKIDKMKETIYENIDKVKDGIGPTVESLIGETKGKLKTWERIWIYILTVIVLGGVVFNAISG